MRTSGQCNSGLFGVKGLRQVACFRNRQRFFGQGLEIGYTSPLDVRLGLHKCQFLFDAQCNTDSCLQRQNLYMGQGGE